MCRPTNPSVTSLVKKKKNIHMNKQTVNCSNTRKTKRTKSITFEFTWNWCERALDEFKHRFKSTSNVIPDREICQWPGNCYFIEMYAIRSDLLAEAEKKNSKQRNGTYFQTIILGFWFRFIDLSHETKKNKQEKHKIASTICFLCEAERKNRFISNLFSFQTDRKKNISKNFIKFPIRIERF